jgi:hypothetical protein
MTAVLSVHPLSALATLWISRADRKRFGQFRHSQSVYRGKLIFCRRHFSFLHRVQYPRKWYDGVEGSLQIINCVPDPGMVEWLRLGQEFQSAFDGGTIDCVDPRYPLTKVGSRCGPISYTWVAQRPCEMFEIGGLGQVNHTTQRCQLWVTDIATGYTRLHLPLRMLVARGTLLSRCVHRLTGSGG